MCKFVDFFQICHLSDQPISKQCKHNAAEIRECKEADWKKDSTEKICAAACCKNSSSNDHEPHSNRVFRKNYCHICKSDGDDMLWQS